METVFIISKWILNNTPLWGTRIILEVMKPVFDLTIYLILLLMAITWIFTKYPIKVTSVLGIWTMNCLIPEMDTKLMGIHQNIRDGDNSQTLKYFTK